MSGIVLKTTVDTSAAKAMLARLAAELTPEKADRTIEAAAFKVQAMVIIDTKEAIMNYAKRPRWNIAKPENKWMVRKIENSRWEVVNADKVMRFLEFGTRAHGPVTKKFLYIPMVRRAAGGWRKGFKWGRDFILARWVKGIRAYGIVETARRKAVDILLEEMRAFVRRAVAKAQNG